MSKLGVLKRIKPKVVNFKKFVVWSSKYRKVPVRGGIAYSARARRLIKFYPNIRKHVFEAFKKIVEGNGDVHRVGNIVLHVLPHVKGEVGNWFFKLAVGKRTFFLKVIESKIVKDSFIASYDLALTQHRALLDAKKLLENSEFKGKFGVVSPEFAFVSDKYSFQLTDFSNCERVKDILNNPSSPAFLSLQKKLPDYEKALEFLQKNGFGDSGKHNTFFSHLTGKFTFFDLRRG